MLIHANAIPDGTVLECDLCIVGAGPAGMTIAHKLRNRNLSIVLLDSGFEEFDERAQRLAEGTNIGLEYRDLDLTRLRMLGGSSNHWEGSCNDLDEIDFTDREWVDHDGWPITKQDLVPYYKSAQPYLQLGPYDYDLRSWLKRLNLPFPTWIRDGLEGWVVQHSAPTRYGQVYGGDLADAANVRVLLGATVLSMSMTADRRTAEHVVVGRFGKGNLRVRAKRFVLAMGGIENARFLLLNDIGNGHDQVGRYFMEHPYFRLMLLAPSLTFLREFSALNRGMDRDSRASPLIRFSEEVLRREKFQNCRISFEAATRYEAAAGIESFHQLGVGTRSEDEVFYHIGNMLLDVDMLAEATSRKVLGKPIFESAEDVSFLWLGCMSEQLPNPESRVTLGNTRDEFGQPKTALALRLTEADHIAAGRFATAVGKTFGQVGIGRVQHFVAERFAHWPPRQISYGNHHMGTTRMSKDPKQGVVDADLRLHGASNLFIAGSSVFPTGGHVPPTLTIVALSLRLADHLVAHG